MIAVSAFPHSWVNSGTSEWWTEARLVERLDTHGFVHCIADLRDEPLGAVFASHRFVLATDDEDLVHNAGGGGGAAEVKADLAAHWR